MVKIEEGELQKITAEITGDELQASGDITILYNDIKLGLLELDEGKNTMDKKSVTSFLANTFVLKKIILKKVKSREKLKLNLSGSGRGGFFLLVWKTILTGALKHDRCTN
jgi:hypothetical protein